MVDNFGLYVITSTAIPTTVFITETASAPSSSTTFAISEMRVIFGVNFTINAFLVAFLTRFVISPVASQLVPKLNPPSLTLGQDTFISYP